MPGKIEQRAQMMLQYVNSGKEERNKQPVIGQSQAPVERALIKRGEQNGGRKVVTYVPSNFSQSPRILTEHVGIDTFLVTVSPMDRHGYFTFGTSNDYSSKAARAARHLIVEVNERMPRGLWCTCGIACLGERLARSAVSPVFQPGYIE